MHAPITVSPSYQWFTIDEATVVHELAPFIWSYGGFEIAAHSELTVTADCPFPFDEHPMHIVTLLPHMHRLGIELDAGALGGERFLESPGYDPENGVLLQYDPPVDLGAAAGVSFSCTWNNTLDHAVMEGVGDNEMCIVFGYAWPSDQAYTAIAADGSCLSFPTP